MMNLEWLDKFRADRKDHWSNAVFRVDRHICATDTRILVAVVSDAPGFAEPIHERRDGKGTVADSVRGYLAADFSGAIEIDRSALADFAGPMFEPSTITCPECNGRKHVRHECSCRFCTELTQPCEDCNETGIVEEEPSTRNGWIGQRLFDLNLIAKLLALAPAGVTIFIKDKPQSKQPTMIRTADWICCVMPMDADSVIKRGVNPEKWKRFELRKAVTA